MAWTPRRSLAEWLKAHCVPPGLYIRYLHQKAISRGEREIRLVPFLARPDRISLDVGANKGVYSRALLKHSQAVHAFEPNPKPLATLRAWGAGSVHIHPVALGNHSGTAELRIPKSARGYSNQGASLSRVKVDGEHSVVTVEQIRLDDLNLTNIGFIKIDVEGFEREVLEGATQTLRRERPNLLIELEERHTKTPLPELIATVSAHGYRAYGLVDGQLTAFEHIDLDRHHHNPVQRDDYIFNFIFLPA
jgi:FkbM family methyltransferase